MAITARDLRYKTASILDKVSKGERIVVTRRGKPKAVLVPAVMGSSGDIPVSDEAFGIWKDHPGVKDTCKWLAKIRSPRYPQL